MRDDGDGEDERLSRAFAVSDSQEALRLAYERWGGMVYAIALRGMPPQDAEDIVQQTFVSVWRSRSAYDPDAGPLGAWIMTIARRRIADHWRSKQQYEIALDPDDLAGLQGGDDRDSVLEEVSDALIVQEELQRIGEPQRTIVRLAIVEDRSMASIAASLDMPVGTVKSHLSRALQRIRDRWEETHGAPVE